MYSAFTEMYIQLLHSSSESDVEILLPMPLLCIHYVGDYMYLQNWPFLCGLLVDYNQIHCAGVQETWHNGMYFHTCTYSQFLVLTHAIYF